MPLVLLTVGCNRLTSNTSSPPETVEPVLSSRPPYKTREPERYRATRVTLSEESVAGATPTTTQTTTTRVFRSGVNRREEYESSNGNALVYLENRSGRFVIIPGLKVFAELSAGSLPMGPLPQETTSADVTNGVLTENVVEAIYQTLGAEELNGRRTVKYLVRESSGDAGEAGRDTFVWVDDELGMPIRSESTHTEGATSVHFITELRDVSTDVNEDVFQLPKDFQKVEHAKLLQRMAELTR